MYHIKTTGALENKIYYQLKHKTFVFCVYEYWIGLDKKIKKSLFQYSKQLWKINSGVTISYSPERLSSSLTAVGQKLPGAAV